MKVIWFIVGLAVSVGGGHLLTGVVLKGLRKKRDDIIKPKGNYNWLLGCLERVVYTMAILAKFEGFIGIWLGMKGLGRWVNKDYGVLLEIKEDRSNIAEVNQARTAVVNIFLIGNLLSLISAVIGAVIIKNLAGFDLLNLF